MTKLPGMFWSGETLTDSAIAHLRPREREYTVWDTHVAGLGVRVREFCNGLVAKISAPPRAARDRCHAAAMRAGAPGKAAPGSSPPAPHAPIAAPQAPLAGPGRYRQARESDRPLSRPRSAKMAAATLGFLSSRDA